MAKRTFIMTGYATMEHTVDDTHPHFNDEDILREEAMEAWHAAKKKMPKGVVLEGKAEIEEQ